MLYAWDVRARAAEVALQPAPPSPVESQPGNASPSAAPSVVAAAGDQAAVAAGATLFGANCNSCHPGGNAGVGPTLHGPRFLAGVPNVASITARIRSGGGEMPPFGPDQLSDQDVANVAAYIISLNLPSASPTPAPASKPAAAPAAATTASALASPAGQVRSGVATPVIPAGTVTSTAPQPRPRTPAPSGPQATPVIPAGALVASTPVPRSPAPSTSAAGPSPSSASPGASGQRATPVIPAGPLPSATPAPVSSAATPAGTPQPTPAIPAQLPGH